MLPHVLVGEKALAEAVRVLRPGGLLDTSALRLLGWWERDACGRGRSR